LAVATIGLVTFAVIFEYSQSKLSKSINKGYYFHKCPHLFDHPKLLLLNITRWIP